MTQNTNQNFENEDAQEFCDLAGFSLWRSSEINRRVILARKAGNINPLPELVEVCHKSLEIELEASEKAYLIKLIQERVANASVEYLRKLVDL